MPILLAYTCGGSMILTDENFLTTVNTNEVILVDFWAEWCGPCRMLTPVLEDFSKEYNIPVVKLNVDENPEKTREYSVHSIPTMVLFVNGEPVKTITGAKPKHILVKELSEWI